MPPSSCIGSRIGTVGLILPKGIADLSFGATGDDPQAENIWLVMGEREQSRTHAKSAANSELRSNE